MGPSLQGGTCVRNAWSVRGIGGVCDGLCNGETGAQDCGDGRFGHAGHGTCLMQKTCVSQTASQGIGPTSQRLKQLGAPIPRTSSTQQQS